VETSFQCRKPVLIHRHSAANHLYRIAQEALNNAVKHGKPTRTCIRLATRRDRITLAVRDNGAGIRRNAGRARGMGLQIMQYRADAIGGSLRVHSSPGGGTEVLCTVTCQALLPQENAK